MTPPCSYRNYILGRSGTLFPHGDTAGAVSQLQTMARLSQTTLGSQGRQQSDIAARLLLQGAERQGREITDSARDAETQQVRQSLDYYSAQARGGDRRSYYDG